MSTTHREPWVEEQLTDPVFRREYLRELIRMQREAVESHDAELARWCMRQRARLDSTDSTG